MINSTWKYSKKVTLKFEADGGTLLAIKKCRHCRKRYHCTGTRDPHFTAVNSARSSSDIE